MARVNVLSGQVHGMVDWITSDHRELGMFLRTGAERESTRCVLHGPEVERLLSNGVVQKGMLATAHGSMSARCQRRHDDGSWMVEALCRADRIVAEPAKEGRIGGSVHVNLKGVVMFWDASTHQLKTYFNPEPGVQEERVTCSIHMKPWLAGMSEVGRSRLLSMMRVGREFTTSSLLQLNSYRTKTGDTVPSMMLLPTDFRLQS